MKIFTRWFAAVGMTVALLGCSAAMAAEPSINVQLDGQTLTFTDAVPQVKDQRTFLPFRAVFEAMGAEVSSEGSVITAVRGGKTLTMTLDSTAATVTENGKETPITMDVAPYVDSATWRTYVPVRFAAQAFGCAVGWDQGSSTAIIVDTDKVVDKALEGKSFTYLEKLMEYSKKYNQGIWDMEAGFDAGMTVMSMPMTMSGSVKGTVENSEKMNMDMNMKMDLSELIKAISTLSMEETTLSPEDQAMLDTLKNQGIDLSIRGDMGKGTLYMNMKGDILTTAGMNGNDWYKMDMAALMEQSGMDWGEVLKMSRDLDYTVLAKQALSSLALTDSTTAYDGVKTAVESVLTALSDEGFVQEGEEYTAMVDLQEGNSTVTVVLVLGMKKETVVGYTMGMYMEAVENDMTVSMDMTVSVDEKDRMTAEMHMDSAGLMTVDLTMEGGYTQGKTAPVTEPPAGASVVDFMALAGAEEQAALGVIGGADGPTTVIVPGVKKSGKYVGSLDSDKYHYRDCRFAEKILPENEIWFDTVEEAESMDYDACGVCNPR